MEKAVISNHGYVQSIKRFLDSLNDELFKNEVESNPHLKNLVKAINYERG